MAAGRSDLMKIDRGRAISINSVEMALVSLHLVFGFYLFFFNKFAVNYFLK